MIDGQLHVYYVIEDDGRCEYQIADESSRKWRINGKLPLSGTLPDVMGNAVADIMTKIIIQRDNDLWGPKDVK